jgi:putative membrane-bound dehydrogenase-like protein
MLKKKQKSYIYSNKMISNSKYRTFSSRTTALFLLVALICGTTVGCNNAGNEIKVPDDAPKPLSPTDAVKSFQLPPGFRIELVASEPLISDPTGVCWDEKGRLYVSELHGYNLPGQLEIEDINKSGVLDTTVQRVQAADKYERAAEAGTFGRVKRLSDTNGDGVMDKVELFADSLPPAYGLIAARGGLIVAGQTEIVYIADRDDDGKAEVRETLFMGWPDYELERGISTPQWGPGGWIYFGAGAGGGQITGPYLKEPVQMPETDFRIRADGSAIEPVTGSGGTIGFAFTADGYKFNNYSTYSIPIEWKYLERNPYATISNLTVSAADYSTIFPVAPVHPWRLTRSNDPEWREYYSSRYGEKEVEVAGYFTGDCCPMVYHEDSLFPPEFIGNLFVSEPAGKLVHRSIVEPDGTGLKVRRADSEQNREFLASTDSWFSPVGLAQAPDGSIYISDFYREIIEDYSAVPRPMQQLYRLNHGADKGRIWRVSPVTAKPLKSMERVDLTNANLDKELDNPHYWRRQTADRLLHEQQGSQAPALMKRRLELAELRSDTPQRDFISTLRTQDTVLKTDVATARKLVKMSREISDERMLLQLVLSLGYSRDDEVFNALIDLAQKHANIRWMPDAIMTVVHERAGIMLRELLKEPGPTGQILLEPLAASISARNNDADLTAALIAIAKSDSPKLQAASLKGINRNMKTIPLNNIGKTSLNSLLQINDQAVREQAISLALKLNLGNSKAFDAIRQKAMKDVANPQLATEKRLKAVDLLSGSPDGQASRSLISAWTTATPPVKSAILEALISRGERLSPLIEAMSTHVIPVNYLTPLQRTQLLERADNQQRHLLENIFSKAIDPDKEAIYARYVKGLEGGNGNVEHGGKLFQIMCSSCHQVNEIGTVVGPDLKRAFQASEKTLLRDILWPSEKITSGYDIFTVTTDNNEKYSGVLVNESANSVMLRQVGGTEQTFLRTDIKELTSSRTSLMPEFGEALSPQDCADIIAWIRESLTTK